MCTQKPTYIVICTASKIPFQMHIKERCAAVFELQNTIKQDSLEISPFKTHDLWWACSLDCPLKTLDLWWACSPDCPFKSNPRPTVQGCLSWLHGAVSCLPRSLGPWCPDASAECVKIIYLLKIEFVTENIFIYLSGALMTCFFWKDER